jgi:hypothetical protein
LAIACRVSSLIQSPFDLKTYDNLIRQEIAQPSLDWQDEQGRFHSSQLDEKPRLAASSF